jgi:dTDP-N-acetylfucosamine:lipid II N-acetylfucosaminyltransferase
MMAEKFMSPFIDVINNHFKKGEHKMVVINIANIECPLSLKEQDGVIWITKKHELFKLSYLLNTSNKIILHGLFLNSLIISLFFQPWLLKKCYWVMWGGDFYLPMKQRWFKKRVIKRIRNFVTYLKGDFDLVKKWYGAKGVMHECFMYPSNLYKEYDLKPNEDGGIINIQVGNSADSTNNHIEVFEKLRKYKDGNIKIYAPLSYSDQDHVKDVIIKGKEIFEDKFIALTDFMPFEKYLDFLGTIDIAIFAHKRQQAMGNIITLLGLGKKVYIRNDITTWQFFKDINVKVFDFDNVELERIDDAPKTENIGNIKSYFSEKNYLNQLNKFFN